VILRSSLVFSIVCCVSSVFFLGNTYAQSNGLRLGEPAADTNTLNLGAADKEAPPPAQPTASQSGGAESRTRHGDWDVACDPAGDNCAMAQIGNDANGTPVLEMVIRQLAEPLEVGERTATAVLDVITPLGVVLTEGLSISIDGDRKESAPFQVCTEQGCLVREPVDDELIARLKRGNKAAVSVIAASQGEVSSIISLKGFTKAYDSLK